MTYTGLNDQFKVKNALTRLIAGGHLGQFNEAYGRGFISMACGEVDSIEDIASAVKFDADIAEGLSFIAASATINVSFSQLMSSASLNKICVRCGLPHDVIAAVLALVNQDYKSGFEIDEALSLIKVDGRFLKSIMAIYSDEDQNTRE